MAPSAYPAMVGREAAPALDAVPAADDAEPEAERDADAEVEPDAEAEVAAPVPFAFPPFDTAAAVTPVLFWQFELYCSVERAACVKVMSAHYEHC